MSEPSGLPKRNRRIPEQRDGRAGYQPATGADKRDLSNLGALLRTDGDTNLNNELARIEALELAQPAGYEDEISTMLNSIFGDRVKMANISLTLLVRLHHLLGTYAARPEAKITALTMALHLASALVGPEHDPDTVIDIAVELAEEQAEFDGNPQLAIQTLNSVTGFAQTEAQTLRLTDAREQITKKD